VLNDNLTNSNKIQYIIFIHFKQNPNNPFKLLNDSLQRNEDFLKPIDKK